MYPNKLLGVVGDHDEFPVERIAMSQDRKFLASCSHDSTVQFWDIGFLTEEGNDDDDEMSDEGEDPSTKKPPQSSGAGSQDSGFFGDL